MLKKLYLLLISIVVSTTFVCADEGMWIPMLLNRNEAAMQKAGMRISAKDIYDVNNACLKDAVILFNQGCTGEFVSAEGLFLTNHHCGYSYIVKNSTVEHDYLTNGFWAMSREQEIPCQGLTATRLVRMEDVTAQVLEGIDENTLEEDRPGIVKMNIEKIVKKVVEGTHYKAVIKPFYYGNQYFLYINEVFTDVRLVGAPPSNIGKFGGDTDNWMWPRHTGDFSMFRVYAAPDGSPADYSKDNVPYHPLKHLEISLKGVQEGDFTFVFGYPGQTQRYAYSSWVDYIANDADTLLVNIADIALRHYKEAMEQSPAKRLRYASKVASIANSWKKRQGEHLGINRLNGVAQKRQFEASFSRWASDKPLYRDVVKELGDAYPIYNRYNKESQVFNYGVFASTFMDRVYDFSELANAWTTTDSMFNVQLTKVRPALEAYYPDEVDKAIFLETFIYMWKTGNAPYLNEYGSTEEKILKKLNKIYDRSILNNHDKLVDFLQHCSLKNQKTISKDPAVELITLAMDSVFTKDRNADFFLYRNKIDQLMRTYVKGMMEMYPDSVFFPDANLTLRVAYGHVKGFAPSDGVYYKPYSTIEGIMQKENPDIYDYVVEPRLKELYDKKDYGRYANSVGELPVGFLATNHTTGGNSGSPVLNADGRLVGINFDRCWEGTMSDLIFDPNYCRNISLDIRYCLFIIDKFAGASHLIDEMTIVE